MLLMDVLAVFWVKKTPFGGNTEFLNVERSSRQAIHYADHLGVQSVLVNRTPGFLLRGSDGRHDTDH